MGSTKGLVLIVEDDRNIASVQELYLARDGFSTQVETDGLRGLDAVERLRPVAVVLDVALPGLDGVTFCRRLRERQDWTPVLMVTARADEPDRILGLELGADDYVTKPFSPGELVARVNTVLRRTQGPPGGRPHVMGTLRVDPARRTVHRDGEEVELTATEFNLLAHLLDHRGRVFTRRQLLAHVWGEEAYRDPRVVDVYVSQLRSKLGEASPIRTVRGVGYGATDRPA
ncbi:MULTISPECIES: response regulator transcription factor [unclassified Streptomyces]|uniref:response regulator transcription factor n=1 Tax=unclassified Streptomyces TaxID=2593676 RepID=UPI001F040D58|nr:MULTISPECIES: response regulator transcription factor [unclassified Streptomyces]MCH0565577.1 response regulator transcription factor [Streptomyces sp. MUM 2J]MCH0572100.1 response regulator transcription factor [Streptomyces sp. MUM 136J]